MHRQRIANGGSARTSHHINRLPAVNIHHATRFAERIGRPLNQSVTINLSQMGCSHAAASGLFRRILANRFAPWLRRAAPNIDGVAPTYVWTLEAAGGQDAVHWLVHIPKPLMGVFREKLLEWIIEVAREPIDATALHITPVYNLVGVRRYILKGVSPVWGSHLGVRPVPQGVVVGKRSGFSRNLGPAARKRSGYVPRRAPFARADGIGRPSI